MPFSGRESVDVDERAGTITVMRSWRVCVLIAATTFQWVETAASASMTYFRNLMVSLSF